MKRRGEWSAVTLHIKKSPQPSISLNPSTTSPAHPGILPLVGHGDDVPVEEVSPVLSVAAPLAGLRGFGLVRVSINPGLHDVVVELLGPQQACVCVCVCVRECVWKL